MSKGDDTTPLTTKIDMCITDGLIKASGGALLGTIASMTFLKRHRWPIIAGFGIGVGLACANCEYELKKAISTSLS